jgi:Ni/Co efflux regulator RcnB
MTFERVKKVITKGVISLVIGAAMVFTAGSATGSLALAANGNAQWQRDRDRDRDRDHDRDWSRRHEREELDRVRRFDRDHQLRYRWNSSSRVVGFYDRFGRFHPYGFYDRFGSFHRY